MPLPTTAAQIFPAGRESLPGGRAPTSVVSTATASRMAVDEETLGELLMEDHFPKEMHRKERKNARRAAERREATRPQLDQDEKREAEATRSSRPDVAMCVDGSTRT